MTDPRWRDWIGREQRASDTLSSGLLRRWLATFDLPDQADGCVPQGMHFCLCPPDTPTAGLGPDGHPERVGEHGFLPPIPLPRRMWAGSALFFHAPLPVGAAVERTSRIVSVTEKSGGAGPLAFVEVEHQTLTDGALAVSETQTLVYRAAAGPDAQLSPPEPQGSGFDPAGWDAHRTLVPDAKLLFRYSALTFNTHRIHYDLPYAREVERYRGLVVHGPLIATLLLRLVAERIGDNRLASFAFKGLSPAIAGEPLHLAMREEADGIALAAFADNGRQVTQASARVR